MRLQKIIANATLLFSLAFPLFPSLAAEPSSTPHLRLAPDMHTARIKVFVDASERFVVTASDDKTAKIWSRDGKLLKTLRPPIGEGNEGKIFAASISPDAKLIALGGWTDDQNSIYFFDRESGQMIRRIAGLAGVNNVLAFSPDGKYLAAGVSQFGVAIFSVSTGQMVGQDRAYSGEVYGLGWSNRRLAASSQDGRVRLYELTDSDLRKTQEAVAPGGKFPFRLAFSPKGDSLAVGYDDTVGVSVFDGKTLAFKFSPDLSELTGGDLASVAWSSDGKILWATGNAFRKIGGKSKGIIRRWADEGRAKGQDMILPSRPAASFALVASGGVIYSNTLPSWSELDAVGKPRTLIASPTISYRNDLSGHVQVSDDGLKIGFKQYHFDLGKKRLTEQANTSLFESRRTSPNVLVTGWEDTEDVRLNGVALKLQKNEGGRSLAIAVDNRSIVLGADWTLRRFDANAKQLWRKDSPGTVWSVNYTRQDQLIVAAYGDGTVRWHRSDNGEELLALYVHPDMKRWVLWTPNGYFEASPGAEDLIGWHINQGADKEARFVKGGQLYGALYRPDLIERAAAGEDPNNFPKADLEKLLATGDAPKLSFVAPATGESKNRDVTLKYRVCDSGGGIGKRVLRINGMTVALVEGDRGLKLKAGVKTEETCFDEERLISLQAGDNLIAISAFNKAGQIESTPEVLNLALHGNVPAGGKPTLHVMALAVDQYRDGDLRLAYSRKDAQGLIDNLKQVGGALYGEIKVHTLFDDQVRKLGVGEKFDQLATQIKPEDVFVLYMAGHGVTDRDDGNYYYLPVDFRFADKDSVRKQAISNTFFQENLAKIKAGKSLVLLDTCNSGSFQAVKTRGVEEKTAIARLVKATGRATLMASSSSQVALEGYEGHGVFTWALIEGLKGKAAKDRQITVGGLADYVAEILPDLTYKKFGYEQVPQRDLQGMNFPIGVR